MKDKVVAALSGGVDSSVAAFLLREKGYKVVGATLLLYDECGKDTSKSCCSLEDVFSAKEVASKLKIEHFVLDRKKLFLNAVQNKYLEEMAEGKTPNPCIFCNKFLKFGSLLEWAIKNGFDFVATGHYARIVATKEKVELFRGVDKNKDQSYFLFTVEDESLRRTIFPLGEMTKSEVRKIAKEVGLPTFEKRESQDLCFGKGDNLKKILSSCGIEDKKGDVLFKGKKIGQHKGLSNYTVGQRKGISIPYSEPLYVIKIDKKNNTLIVGTKEMAKRKRFKVENWVWRSKESINSFDLQVRYRMKPLKAKFIEEGKDCFIEWVDEREVAAPGQAAVGYLGQKVIGGGFIAYEDF